MPEKIVLITGASTGFGRLVARMLPGAGHRPIASMRDVDGRNAEHAEALRTSGVDVVEIDVTDEASVSSAVAAALDVAERIDVLVDNAGFGVFGAHRAFRAVVPMREAGSGLLVHVSSGAGRFAFSNSGPYCISATSSCPSGSTPRSSSPASTGRSSRGPSGGSRGRSSSRPTGTSPRRLAVGGTWSPSAIPRTWPTRSSA